MTSSNTNNARPRGSWIRILLFPFVLLLLMLLSAVPAHGQSVGGCVANFGGVKPAAEAKLHVTSGGLKKLRI